MMMFQGQRLRLVAAMLAPVALVQVGRTLLSGPDASAGPAPAGAAPVVATADSVAPATPAQTAALKHASALQIPDRLRSPLDHPLLAPVQEPPATTATEPAEPQAAPAPAPAAPPPTTWTLGSVLSGSSGALASINGRVQRTGDELAPGWSITGIDPQNFVVTITGPQGQVLTLTR